MEPVKTKSIKPYFMEKMLEARYLFIYENLTRKEIAEELNINNKTVGEWVKEFGWVEYMRAELKRRKEPTSFPGFFEYIKREEPTRYNFIKNIFKQYLNTL